MQALWFVLVEWAVTNGRVGPIEFLGIAKVMAALAGFTCGVNGKELEIHKTQIPEEESDCFL